MNDGKKIVPADVLAMRAADAATLTLSLDEVNRYVLISEMTTWALRHVLTDVQAASYAAVFSELGPARLKLVAWCQLTAGGPEKLPTINAVRRLVMPMVVTGVFGVTVGEAGVGMTPSYRNDEDRADVEAMRSWTGVDHRARYEALAMAASEAGTLRILVGGSV